MRVLRRVCRFNVYDLKSLCALLIQCCCYSYVILLHLSKLQCGIYSTPSKTPRNSWIPHCQTMQEGVNMRAHKRHNPNPLQIACAINVSSTPLLAWTHRPGDPAGRGNDWWTGVVPEVVLVCSASSFLDAAFFPSIKNTGFTCYK